MGCCTGCAVQQPASALLVCPLHSPPGATATWLSPALLPSPALMCCAAAATVVLYGSAISDPIALLSKVEGAWGIAAALVGLILATLTTNIAANVVAPANVSGAGLAAGPGACDRCCS